MPEKEGKDQANAKAHPPCHKEEGPTSQVPELLQDNKPLRHLLHGLGKDLGLSGGNHQLYYMRARVGVTIYTDLQPTISTLYTHLQPIIYTLIQSFCHSIMLINPFHVAVEPTVYAKGNMAPVWACSCFTNVQLTRDALKYCS